ncbi:SDR family oxidoreductase [Pelagibacteraceae bacterium]|jgi:nucleoside-diphosphate-sugar epimerase|nr:SDR family oxidoreductase [Pelagibacteraceae bacterium]
MKLIITGACGHIGSYVAENIFKIKKIKKTILIDNLKSNRFCSIFNQKKKNNLEFHLGDLNNEKSLNKFKKVDYLIHLASMTNAEKSFGKEREMFKNNINCLKTVIKFCKKNKIKLIHLSSTSVYGKQADLVDETCEKKYLKPQSPYAKIKLIEEKMLKKEKNLQYITFRFGTISGISQGIRFHTAVNKFCLNAAINEDITVYKTALHQYRPYLSLKDAFKTFKFCIENNFFKKDIYNALSGNFTVNQILTKIKKHKKNIKIKFVNSAIMNQLSYHVDDKKLSSCGLKLSSKIDSDIKETLNLLKNI